MYTRNITGKGAPSQCYYIHEQFRLCNWYTPILKEIIVEGQNPHLAFQLFGQSYINITPLQATAYIHTWKVEINQI